MSIKKSKSVSVPREAMYLTWSNDKEKAAAMYEAGEALRKVEPVVRSHGSQLYLNVAPQNVSVRTGMNRGDYDAVRTDEVIPTKPKPIIRASMDAYSNIGLIRNIIDLMGDFATQGIDVLHPNERIEKWWKEWFRRVGGKERSERFLNILYRCANVIVKRHTAKLPVRIEDQMRRSGADVDMEIDEGPKFQKREIPWRYTFLNPLSVEVIADELSLFVGHEDFNYALKVPRSLVRRIKDPQSAVEKRLVAKLPEDVKKAIERGSHLLPLDPSKVKGYYYKRDDWQVWAEPMVYSILADLQLLQKMKLADMAALDGAISCIRVWKLGSEKSGIMPGPAAMNRLAEMLCNNVGGGVMDLVWDFAIELLETKTDVHHFLGSTKYEPVLTAIYAGLGIPPTLTGANSQGGFTNNFISLKTLTERLQYGRDILAAFWEEEIRVVQKAMGFRFPAEITFDRMVLSDEAAEKQLLLNLWDRNLISDESIRERFREVPEIEYLRVNREWRKRQGGKVPEKASPFHQGEKDFEYKKLFVNAGDVTPSELGIELEERKAGEKSMLDRQEEQTVKQDKLKMQSDQQNNDHQFRTEKLQLKHGVHPGQVQKVALKGQPGQGRPKNKKDTGPRKKKRVLPRTSASAIFFDTLRLAQDTQAAVGQMAGPAYLAKLGKKTLRELTDAEAEKFENYKFFMLCQAEPGQVVDEKMLAEAGKKELSIPTKVAELVTVTVAKHVETHGKPPTVEVLRFYRAGAYAFWKANFESDEEWVEAEGT